MRDKKPKPGELSGQDEITFWYFLHFLQKTEKSYPLNFDAAELFTALNKTDRI